MNILVVLVRRKFLILGIFLAFVSVCVAVTLTAPQRYEARMKVLVKHERADLVVSANTSSAAVRSEVSESDVNSEIELLTSGDLLRQIVLQNGLAARGNAGGSQEPSGPAVERAVRELAANLKIAPVRKASIIQVVYSSENAEQVATVLSSVAELYLQKHLSVHRTAGTQEFFRSQAQQHEQELLAAQERLAGFRRQNNVVSLPEQKQSLLQRVMETEQALQESSASLEEASGKVTTLQKQLTMLQPRVLTQSRVVPNQYSVERLHTLIADLQNRRTSLIVRFRDDDRLVRELDDQIADTKAAMENAGKLTAVEQTTDVNPLRQTLEAQLAQAELTRSGLSSRRAVLAVALRNWRARLAQMDGVTADHDGFNRQIRQSEESFMLYSRKQEEARIADSLDQRKISNVSIAEAPVKPHRPAKPNVLVNLALGTLMGCLVSVGTAFALEMSKDSFDSAEELQAEMHLPVLASVRAEGC